MNVQAIVTSSQTVSDKIRGLNEAGLERAEIARLLGKRYQHVRNVLEADRLKSARATWQEGRRPTTQAEALSDTAYRLTLDASGTATVPAALTQALGLSAGDTLVADIRGDRIVLKTGKAALKEAQALIRSLVPEGVSLSQSLVDDRRLAAEGGE